MHVNLHKEREGRVAVLYVGNTRRHSLHYCVCDMVCVDIIFIMSSRRTR